MVVDLVRLDRAADMFADIPFGDEGWSGALTAMSEAVGALGTLVLPIRDRKPGDFPCSDSVAEAVHRYAYDGWSDADFRQQGVHRLYTHGTITDLDITTPERMRREPFYQDLCLKSGIWWFAGIRLDIMGETYCASMHKAVGRDPFTSEDLARLLAVAPRISMSLSILSQLDRARTAGLVDALEAMTTAAFLLDRTGRVIRANAAAARLVGSGVDVIGGALLFRGPDAGLFRRHLGTVLADRDIVPSASGQPVLVRRATGRPFIIRALRLRSEAALGYFSSAWALVTVTDPDRRPQSAPEMARLLFRLTPRETRMLELLLATDGDGHTTAARAGVGYETVRTHLKSIHAKAGTRGITELLALVGRLPEA